MVTNRLITENKGLVMSIAKRYQHRGLDFDDLVQEGNIGLILAKSRYRDDMGTKFTTYASYWIKQTIVRAIENTGSLIRVPSNNKSNTPLPMVYDNHDTYDITKELECNDIIDKIKGIINNSLESAMYLDRYMNDLSFRDIGKKYKLSHETVRGKVTLLHDIIKNKLAK